MATNQPILFTSSRCAHSKQILDTLQALNKTSLCRIVSIDGKGRHELPPFLQKVPTLYVPETKDLYVGKDIFGYIAKPVAARREVPVNTPATANPPTATAPGTNLESWSFSTAGGFSDAYSSWDGKNATGDQLHYTFLGGPATQGPPEPQTKQSHEGDKAGKNEDVASRLERIQKERDSEYQGVTRK
jgi:hypothetical protein